MSTHTSHGSLQWSVRSSLQSTISFLVWASFAIIPMSIIMPLYPPTHILTTLMDFTFNAIRYAPFPWDFRDAEKPKVDLPNFFSGSSIAVFLRQSSFEYQSLALKKFSVSLTHPDWLRTHHACNFLHAVNIWTFHSSNSSLDLSNVILVPY